jgi:hypothetical protein
LRIRRRQDRPPTVDSEFDLVISLLQVSECLAEAEDYRNEVLLLEEAVDVGRRLLRTGRPGVEAGLSESLASLSAALAKAGCLDDAIRAGQEVVDRYRAELAAESTAIVTRKLANALDACSRLKSENRNHRAAMQESKEAVTLARSLFAADPGRNAILLARTLTGFAAARISADKQGRRAKAALKKAAAMYVYIGFRRQMFDPFPAELAEIEVLWSAVTAERRNDQRERDAGIVLRDCVWTVMTVNRRTWLLVTGCVVAAGIGVTENVAPMPKSWQSYLWVAWPVLGLLLLASFAVELAHRRAEASARPPTVGGSDEVPGVQQNVTAHGGLAQGVVYGNVINHGRPVRDVTDASIDSSGGDAPRHGD